MALLMKGWEGLRSTFTPLSLPILGWDLGVRKTCKESRIGFTEKLPNGKYRARWHDPTDKQRSSTFDLERDAKKHVRNAQADIDRGVYVDDKAGKMTFGEWAEHYMALAEKRLARTSYAWDRSYLDNHVLPRWGKVKIGRINRTDVDKGIAELSEDGASVREQGGSLAPGTVEKMYPVFRKIIDGAYDDGRIGRLPCPEHPPIPRKKRKAVRFLDEGQVSTLADKFHRRYEAMIYVGAYGGFRIGELCALRVDDVDWDRPEPGIALRHPCVRCTRHQDRAERTWRGSSQSSARRLTNHISRILLCLYRSWGYTDP